MILDMAMEKKKKMEEAKKSGNGKFHNFSFFLNEVFPHPNTFSYSSKGSNSYSYNSGGFVGVNKLTSKYITLNVLISLSKIQFFRKLNKYN